MHGRASIIGPRRRPPRPNARGFKLIEVMVSIGILGIAIAGLIRLHSALVRGVARSQMVSIALDVAAQRAEDLVTLGPTAAPACAGAPGCQAAGMSAFAADLSPAGSFPCTDRVDPFRIDTVVTDHPSGFQPDARLVTVSVCWQDVGGAVRQVQTRRLLVPGV